MTNKGLFQKYEVKKLSDPSKNVQAVVLEFDDKSARKAIVTWAIEMRNKNNKLFQDVVDKLNLRILTVNCREDLSVYRGGNYDLIILDNYDYISSKVLQSFKKMQLIPMIILSRGQIVYGKKYNE